MYTSYILCCILISLLLIYIFLLKSILSFDQTFSYILKKKSIFINIINSYYKLYVYI